MIERKPIKINRIPIKLSQDTKMKLKIQEMEKLTRDDDIMEIAEHYAMLVRQVRHLPNYYSLSYKNPKSHKNWVHFERVYEVCRLKGWNAKLYIESQFKRAKNWKSEYPFTNTLYSTSALRFYTNYLSKIDQEYEKGIDAEKRKRGKETQDIRAEILEQVISTVETIVFYLKLSKYTSPEEYKVAKIFQCWEEFSPYYLYTIPWFHKVIRELPNETVEPLLKVFGMIDKNKSLQTTIREVVSQVEEHYNMPKNITLE